MRTFEFLELSNAAVRTWLSAGGKGKNSIQDGNLNFLLFYEWLTGECQVTVRKEPVDGRCLFWMLLPLMRQEVDPRREPVLQYLLAAAHAIKANPTLQLPEWAPPRKSKDIRRCSTWDHNVSVFEEFSKALTKMLDERSHKARSGAKGEGNDAGEAAGGGAAGDGGPPAGAAGGADSWAGLIAPPAQPPQQPPSW
eukprot:gene12123-11951_t